MIANPTRGLTFVRTIKALAVARGEPGAAAIYAQSQRWSNEDAVVESLEARLAAVTATGTGEMPQPTPAEFDFAEFVRPLTILGNPKVASRVRHHPSRVRTISVTSGS